MLMGCRRAARSWFFLCRFLRFAALLSLLSAASQVSAQLPMGNRVYHPLNQMHPPGTAAAWAARLGWVSGLSFQAIQFELPSRGRITLYNTSPDQPVTLDHMSQAGLAVGHTYRFKISHMPEYPGLELFPSIEVLDRLHPPAGKEHEFPIPVEFTEKEIDFALEGRLITRVIYLEQPQFAVPRQLEKPLPVRTLRAHRNLLAEADRLGRPMLIIRLGGRLPATNGDDAAFFGTGAPVSITTVKTKPSAKPR